MVGGDGGEDMATLRVDLAAVALHSARGSAEQQKSVIRGDDEAAHTGVAQQPPSSPEALDRVVEEGRSYTLLPRVVDLQAVHNDQTGTGDGLLQAGRIARHHLLEGQPGAGRAAHSGVNRALSAVGVGYRELADEKPRMLSPATDGRNRPRSVTGAKHVHSHLGERRQLRKPRVESDVRGWGIGKQPKQLLAHLEAQRVDQEKRRRSGLLGQRPHHLLEQGALLQFGAGRKP